MESTNNPKYYCPYCKKQVLVSGYYRHQQVKHFDSFWTEENLRHLSLAYNRAKKGKIDIITIPDVKGIGSIFYLNPFCETMYKCETKAKQSLEKTKDLQQKLQPFIEYCEDILKKLNRLDNLPDNNNDNKKLFQQLFISNDSNLEQIAVLEKTKEKFIKLLISELELSESQLNDLYDEAESEASQHVKNHFEKEELLSDMLIDKFSKTTNLPLLRRQAFEKDPQPPVAPPQPPVESVAPAALPAPAPPSEPEPEIAHELTVEKKEEVKEIPTVNEPPSIPPLYSKPKVAKKTVPKREPMNLNIQLPPEPEPESHPAAPKPQPTDADYDSDAGLSALELMKKNLARDVAREQAQQTQVKQAIFPSATIKQSLLLPTKQEESDHPRIISDTKQKKIPKKSVSGFPVR